MNLDKTLFELMNKDTKLKLLSELINFKVEPVDINTFMMDPYYLGSSVGLKDDGSKSVYEVWEHALNEIYPNQYMSDPFVAFTGAIGTGKSNTTKIMICYDIYKCCCLENPYAFFGLIKRPFTVGVGHQHKYKAEANVNEIWEWINSSPWFIEQMNEESSFFNNFRIIPVTKPDDFIGTNMYEFWCTELNFFNVEKGTSLINSAISRLESRFLKGWGLFNHIILDSSDTTNDAVVPIFLKEHPYGRRCKQYKYAIFDAKKELYYNTEDKENIDTDEETFLTNGQKVPNKYFNKPRRTFRVYKGDSEIHPFILPPYNDISFDKKKLSKCDPDRFLDVPLELMDLARGDMTLFLQEKCGVAVESSDQYFNSAYITPLFNIENLVHNQEDLSPSDIVTVDFFNKQDSLINLCREAIDSLPRDRCIFGRLDLGLVNDRAGFSVGYVENLCATNIDGLLSYDPDIVIPISFGISRYPGQETSIEKICELIQYIHSVVPFYLFTTDTYQSFAIQQKNRSIGINSKFLSVDRTKEAYQLSKSFFYRNKVKLVKNNVLKTEILNVYDTGSKIDHHIAKTSLDEIGSDSKDILDSVVGLIKSIYESVQSDPEGVMTPPIITNSAYEKINQNLIDEYISRSKYQKYLSPMRFN